MACFSTSPTRGVPAKQRILHFANHDSLTDLPNRNLLSERMQRAVARGTRYARPFAVMWIDLDRFKSINDSFGHEAGDAVLKGVAERLQASVRASDTVARVGGDEFVVLLEEIRARPDVNAVASKAVNVLPAYP